MNKSVFINKMKKALSITICGLTLMTPIKIEAEEIKYPHYYMCETKASFKDELYYTIDSLPESIQNIIHDNDVYFVVVSASDRLEREYNFDNVLAMYDINNRVVWIEGVYKKNIIDSLKRNKIEKKYYEDKTIDQINEELITFSLLHEIGHMVDFCSGNISKTQEFMDIFEFEKRNFMQSTIYNYENKKISANIDSYLEYFATSFSEYMRYPEELLELCPRTFGFINSFVNNYIINNSKTR